MNTQYQSNNALQKDYAHCLAEQTINNTTSWIGHSPGNQSDFVKGQTFVAAEEGDLRGIEVLPNVVTDAGHLVMTLHSFDEQAQSWGPAIGSATVDLRKPDAGKWINFQIPACHLNKGKSYGFLLHSHDTFIGIGEAAGSAKNPPLSSGKEWMFMGNSQQGSAFSYFSLAFKVRA